MCRSIKTLRRPEPPVTREEMAAAALQFVRKISGYRAPSKANAVAFETAVLEITASTEKLLNGIASRASVPGESSSGFRTSP